MDDSERVEYLLKYWSHRQLAREYEILENKLKEIEDYIKYQMENMDFEKDTKAKMFGAMILVMLEKEVE